jgi:CHAT domain-containing protein/Tfp pilus assembly protein PilF
MAIRRCFDFYEKTAACMRGIFTFVAICGFVSGESLLLGQTVPQVAEHACSTTLLEEPEGCVLTLSPGQTTNLSLAVPQGNVRMLTAEQVNGTVELRSSAEASSGSASQAPEPYTNKAGLHSKIHILLSPESQSGQIIRIGNPSKKSATVLIRVGSASTANALSEQERTAEDAFAHAEFLRSQSTGKSAEALAAYDRAIANWQAAGNQQESARALIWKAFYVFFKQNDYAAALPIAGHALESIPLLEPVEAANCWKIAGFINAQLAHYDAGADAYHSALALFEKTDDLFNQEVVLDNLSKLERLQGHSEAALRDATKAAKLAATIGDPRRQLGVQEEIGAIYLTQGDLESAYNAYETALSLLNTAPDPRLQGYIWSDMGVLYTLMGDFGRATDALEQATAIWKTNPNPAGELNTLDDYGDLLLERNQPEKARDYYDRGLELADKNSIDRARIFLFRGIGKSYLQQGDTTRAEENLHRALTLAHEVNEGDSIAETLCLLGDAAWQRHDFVIADQDYKQCRQASVATHDSYTEIRSEGGLARVALQSGALESAQGHCETALGKIEAVREHLQTENLKTLYFASLHAYYDLDIQILERLDQEHPNEGYQWQSFLIAERARARTLLDQVAATNGELHAVASQPLLAQYVDVERRLRRFEASGARLRGPQESQASTTVRAAIERLTVSEHQLHQEILAADQADTSSAPSHSLTLKALENALPDRHAALVEYWSGEKASYAWSITLSGIRSFRLPPATELNRQCLGFRKTLLAAVSPDPSRTAEQRAAMRLAQEEQLRKLGIQLSRNLLPRGMLAPGTATVFLVADGPIESIPFAALPDGLKASLRDTVFLNEPSATIFSILENNSITSHPMRLAVFALGATSTSTQDGETHSALQSNGRNHSPEFSSLPFAGDEAMMIRATMGTEATQLFSGARIDQATLQNLNWNEFSIGHFAMHAILNQQYAELSGLTLGRERVSGAGSGNFLWYGDVCHLHAKLDLVVLSACNTALGERVPGEGLRGFTQAFFAAGSQRVLGTLWEVDDQATSEWMRHFYQSLKKTRSPATALHDAQKAMAADPQWSAPYYWAGFVLAGDWRPLP